jgi:poly(A) polymerase
MALNIEAPEQLVEKAVAMVGGGETILTSDEVAALRREVGRWGQVRDTRLLEALDAMLVRPDAAMVLALLRAWGLVRLWLPEVAAMDGLHVDATRHHKDLWAHTLQVIGQTPPEADLRWVALCHDIGKCATRAFVDGEVSFWRHEAHGAWLFRGIGARLGMPSERIERIAFVIEHHARTNQFHGEWTDRALRRLVRDAGPRLSDLIAFSRSDWSTQRPARAAAIQAGLDRLEARLAALDDAARRPGLPTGLGDALLKATGRAPGPWLGIWTRRLGAALADGTLAATDPLDAFVRHALALAADDAT